MQYSFNDLVDMSSVIVVAVPDRPATSFNVINFDKKYQELPENMKNMSNGHVPDYKQIIYHFVVKEVLKGELKSGVSIDVIGADDAGAQSAHFNYYAVGMNMSNDYSRYKPRYPAPENGEQILFLRHDGTYHGDTWPGEKESPNSYQFIAHPGSEGFAVKAEIIQRINQADEERW